MKLILDRKEKNANGKIIAVFEIDGDYTEISEDDMPAGFASLLTDGIIIEADYRDGVIHSAALLTEETEQKKNEMSKRLNILFKRGNNK